MSSSQPSCSGFDDAGAEFDEEFRNILDALFCACLDGLQDSDTLLRREVFRLTQMDGHSTAQAAAALGLGENEADEMLARTRRDIAVLMALGLCMPDADAPADPDNTFNCRCGSTSMTRRDVPPTRP